MVASTLGCAARRELNPRLSQESAVQFEAGGCNNATSLVGLHRQSDIASDPLPSQSQDRLSQKYWSLPFSNSIKKLFIFWRDGRTGEFRAGSGARGWDKGERSATKGSQHA